MSAVDRFVLEIIGLATRLYLAEVFLWASVAKIKKPPRLDEIIRLFYPRMVVHSRHLAHGIVLLEVILGILLIPHFHGKSNCDNSCTLHSCPVYRMEDRLWWILCLLRSRRNRESWSFSLSTKYPSCGLRSWSYHLGFLMARAGDAFMAVLCRNSVWVVYARFCLQFYWYPYKADRSSSQEKTTPYRRGSS